MLTLFLKALSFPDAGLQLLLSTPASSQLYSSAKCASVAPLLQLHLQIPEHTQHSFPADILLSMNICPHRKNASIHQCRHSPGIFLNQQSSPSEKLAHRHHPRALGTLPTCYTLTQVQTTPMPKPGSGTVSPNR